MTHFTHAQLEGLWIQAGGSRAMAPIMAAIAEAESSGNSTATGGVGERGLWQINPHAWGSLATWDPLGNARAAVHVLKVQGLRAWTTFTSGAFRQFLHGGAPSFALAGGGGGGGGPNATLTAAGGGLGSLLGNFDPFQWLGNDIARAFGAANPKDLVIRLGLVLLGGLLILTALFMLVGKSATNIALTVAAPEAGMSKAAASGRRAEIAQTMN